MVRDSETDISGPYIGQIRDADARAEVEEHEAIAAQLDTFAASVRRATVPIKVRPMLIHGQLATDEHGPVILIDSEQDEREQVVTLWHETLHLLGMTDETRVEEFAYRLADACPTVLRSLASNINVPTAAAPRSA